MNKDQLEKEIDLNKIIILARKAVLNSILFFIQKLQFIIGFVVSSIILAVVFYFMQKPIYQSEMTVSSLYSNNIFCKELIFKVNKLAEEGNFVELSKVLNLSPEIASEIVKLEYRNYNQDEKFTKIKKDTVLLDVPFNIQALVKNNVILDTLQPSLIKLLSNTEYAKKREKVALENLNFRIERLEKELSSLDSLKGIVSKSFFPRGGGKEGLIYGEPYEPLNVYKEALTLYNEQLRLRSELLLHENVELISGFIKYDRPVQPKLIKTLFYGALIGFVLSVVFLIFNEILKITIKFGKEQKALITH